MRNRRDLIGGFTILALSAAFAAIGAGYPFGTLLRMGPGFFPLVASGILALLGLAVVLTARRETPASEAPVTGSRLPLRTVGAVLGSILAFSLTLERVGLVPATVLLVAIAALAEPRLRPVRTALLAVALAIAGVLLFVEGLGLPIPIFRWAP